MSYKPSIQLLACMLCLVILAGLCACSPYIDQDFVNLNAHVQETIPSIPEKPESPTISKPTEPEGPAVPTVKPGGFILLEPEETKPSTGENEPTNPKPGGNSGNNNSSPKPPSGGQVGNVKISAGLKSALISLGATVPNGERVTAFYPTTNKSGGILILHIVKKDIKTAEQTLYTYYESPSDFATAISGLSEDAYNKTLRLVRHHTSNIPPVTNPETLSIVLFDGYLLWR